jgi:peptide/nickel transport system substrate-binding protein
MTPRRTLGRTASAVAATLALALAACGGDDDDAGSEDEPTTEQTEDTAESADTGPPGTAADTGETSDGTAPAATGGTLTIAAVVDNTSFDPVDFRLGHYVQYWMPVYDTLLVLDPEGELQPNMATEWSYNDDNTVLTLTLRDGITFTDGEPFNADAVKASIEHLRDGGGPFSNYVAAVQDVVAVDDSTVELRLSAPDPQLLYGLAVVGGAMASPAAIAAGTLATSPVGSGAYTLDAGATTPGTEYVYVRNPDYWNPDAYAYDSIVIKPITDVQARLNAIQSGQADTGIIDVQNAAAAEEAGLRIDTTPVDWQGLVIADRGGEVVPALGDVRVRQAINMAFDKDAFVESVIEGHGEPTSQVFGPRSEAYDPDLEGYYSFDVEQAQELMADAGYEDGFEVTMSETPGFQRINPIIVQQLAQIGITVNYEQVPPDTLITELLSGRFPMYFFSLGSQSAGEDIQKLLMPTSPWNTSKYEDPELVALVDEAAAATPGEEQAAAFQEVNRYVVENAWFAPIYRIETIIASNPSVTPTPHAFWVAPFPRDYRPSS